ncbi:piggyBac transposable element-derived protein 4-like protein [Lates japonicus]|uniref:PiggyBac transposable element-derived protein 4-like protein n=1 Tax=Lates japonicus TaxID=270547 RepID=A0AAD3N9J0_LATJO|nr:piggyBac transposable element-derived protein 4-like protein [Lates japonicus]
MRKSAANEDEEYLLGAGSSATSSTDSSDGGEGETLSDVSWRSKNGEIQWAPTNSVTLQFNLPGTGLTQDPPAMPWPELDGPRVEGPRCPQRRAYFGLLLLAGVYRSRGEATCSLWNNQMGRYIFRVIMSVKTFVLISRILHSDDRLSPAPGSK